MARVLIVEDEKSLRRTLSEFLADAGHAVQTAEDAEVALRLLGGHEFDVVVTDIILPRVSGVQLLEKIRKDAPRVVVVMMTGEPTAETATASLRAGAFDYLFKPVTRDAIQRVVGNAAQMRALDDERRRLEQENLNHRHDLERRVAERTQELRALAARLRVVREEERAQIARDIHDVLAQQLTRLKLDVSWLARHLAGPLEEPARAEIQARLAGMAGLTDEAAAAVQGIATAMRPVVLDALGLGAAIEWQIEDFRSRTGIECEASLPAEDPNLDRDCATALFRILQESLTNVARHAQATRVIVSFARMDGSLVLTVEDNGRGIDSSQVDSLPSLGLLGMRERALMLGGEFDIAGTPGSGTTVHVRIPMSDRARAP